MCKYCKKKPIFYILLVFGLAFGFFIMAMLRSAEAATASYAHSSKNTSDLPSLSAFREIFSANGYDVELNAQNSVIFFVAGTYQFYYLPDSSYYLTTYSFAHSYELHMGSFACVTFNISSGEFHFTYSPYSSVSSFSYYDEQNGYVWGKLPSKDAYLITSDPLFSANAAYPVAKKFDSEQGSIQDCVGYRIYYRSTLDLKGITYQIGFDLKNFRSHSMVKLLTLTLKTRFPSYELVEYLKSRNYTPTNVDISQIRQILSEPQFYASYVKSVEVDYETSTFDKSVNFSEFEKTSKHGVWIPWTAFSREGSDFYEQIVEGLTDEQVQEYESWFMPFFRALIIESCMIQPSSEDSNSCASFVIFYDSYEFNSGRTDYKLFTDIYALSRGIYVSRNTVAGTDWDSEDVQTSINSKTEQADKDYESYIREQELLKQQISASAGVGNFLESFTGILSGFPQMTDSIKSAVSALFAPFDYLPSEIRFIFYMTIVLLCAVSIIKFIRG